jgi:hypothetical protein
VRRQVNSASSVVAYPARTATSKLRVGQPLICPRHYLANLSYVHRRSVRVPYVRTSVRGPKKMGRSPYYCVMPAAESIRKKSYSAHVRWCERRAPVESCSFRFVVHAVEVGSPGSLCRHAVHSPTGAPSFAFFAKGRIVRSHPPISHGSSLVP